MTEENQNHETVEELSSIFGTKGIEEIRKWRDLVDNAQGKSDHELCGIKEGPNGELLGIFRKKKP